jgi:hypothetical protein
LIFKPPPFCFWINLLRFGFRRWYSTLKDVQFDTKLDLHAAPSEFPLAPYGSTLTELEEILKERHRSKLVSNCRWNTTPETKSHEVDLKQNGGGLKTKDFKLLTAAVLFWIDLWRDL